MKQFLTFWVFTLIFYGAQSQDVIVTNEQDTINCKITRVTSDYIHFSVFDDKSKVLLMRSRLPLSQITYYNQSQPEAISTDPDQEEEVIELNPIKDENRFIQDDFAPARFRLSLNTGYTYQLGGYEGLPSSYKKQMQSLWNFGTEFHYFVSPNIGIGAKYSHVFTKADQDFNPPIQITQGVFISELREEKIQFNYLAISVLFRDFLYDDQVINYFISGGIIKYRSDLKGDGVPFYQEGETFGFVLGVSYDFLLSENFGVGFGGEVNIARLSEYDNNGTVVPADFSITRVDLTLGFRLYK